MLKNAIRWTGSFFLNRLISGIWAPMLTCIILSCLLALTFGMFDRWGWGDWITQIPGPFDFDHEGADSVMGALLTVQIAILTLYFSITLLILTLAAQSLGSRLIERWIASVTIRATLAQWSGLVAYTLVARTFVMPEVGGYDVPHLTVVAGLVMTLIALGWLGYAYHWLVRTAHVDTSIARLGKDYGQDRQDWGIAVGPPPDDETGTILRAWRSGYLSGFDRDQLIDAARACGGRVAFALPDGEFVVEGDVFARVWNDDDRIAEALYDTCEIVDYRADRPTGPFSLTLLVEIGARALSPGINDHQTAAACVDWIGHGMAKRLSQEAGPMGWFSDDEGVPRLHVPDSGVVAQSLPYLMIMVRAARRSPFIEARLIRAFGAGLARAQSPADRRTLSNLIEELATPADGSERSPQERSAIEAAVAATRTGDAALGLRPVTETIRPDLRPSA